MENCTMNISEFAKMTGISRDTLIYYDKIGLLPAGNRSENSYRLYSRNQLGTAYLISSLREIGIGIKEIQNYAQNRTPEKMKKLFQEKDKAILLEIAKLQRLRGMMKVYTQMADEVIHQPEDTLEIKQLKQAPIFLGQVLPEGKSDPTLELFYSEVEAQGLELGYPLGAIIAQHDLIKGSLLPVKQYYLRLPFPSNAIKPAGFYLVGTTAGDYSESNALYEKMFAYIQDHNLEITGDSYEEYPLNEVSILDQNHYRIRIEIPLSQF